MLHPILCATPSEALARLEALKAQSVERLRAALQDFLTNGTAPDPSLRRARAFAYPELRLTYRPEGPPPQIKRAFGRFAQAGVYATTIAHPQLFSDYLIEQLELLDRDYDFTMEVGLSDQEIPYSYVLDGAALDLSAAQTADLARHFPHPRLGALADEHGHSLARVRTIRCRYLCSTRCGSISPCTASNIIPARRLSMFRTLSCSPITIAMSTHSCAGAPSGWAMAFTPHCRPLA